MPDVMLEVPIQAAAEAVYEALTTQAGLASWWTPDVSAEPKVGSIAEFRFRGGQFVTRMEIMALQPPHRVDWAIRDGSPEWSGTTVTFDIAPAANGTTLRFAHRNYPSTEGSFGQVAFNWAWYLISFKDYLERGTGRPGDPPR